MYQIYVIPSFLMLLLLSARFCVDSKWVTVSEIRLLSSLNFHLFHPCEYTYVHNKLYAMVSALRFLLIMEYPALYAVYIIETAPA